MEQNERMASDLAQTIKRVDDMSLRLALAEKEIQRFDEKISDVKLLIVEKINDLRDDTNAAQTRLQKAIDRWNQIGYWLITLVGGWLALQILGLVQGAT